MKQHLFFRFFWNCSIGFVMLSVSYSQYVPQMGDNASRGINYRPSYELYRMDKIASQGEVSYTGDLGLSIPVLTIPGLHGHDFPITITYSSNITQRQTASWIGLGWDLNVGAIERSVMGRYDEQHNDETNQGGGKAEYAGWLIGSHWSLPQDDRDQIDQYSMNIDGGGEQIIPIHNTTWGEVGLRSFGTLNYKKWDITANIISGYLLYTFEVKKEDGTRYSFGGGGVNGNRANFVKTKLTHTNALPSGSDLVWDFPHKWLLNNIAYPDGASTKIAYSGTDVFYPDNYASVFIDKGNHAPVTSWNMVGAGGMNWPKTNQTYPCSTQGEQFGVVYFQNYWVDTIYTDSHYAVFLHSLPGIANPSAPLDCDKYEKTNCRQRLNTIILYDRATRQELKRVNFEYETENRLNNSQLTLKAIQIQSGLMPDPEPSDIMRYEFVYNDQNPQVDWKAQILNGGRFDGDPFNPGYQTDTVFNKTWRLKELRLPTGGKITYEYEGLNTLNYTVWFDPEGHDARTTPGYNGKPWSYLAQPRCRLKTKTVEDPFGRTNKWIFEYGEAVYNPPLRPNLSNYVQAYYRETSPTYIPGTEYDLYKYFRGCSIGHRWTKTINPDGSWSKTYYTSSYSGTGYDSRESFPDETTNQNSPPFFTVMLRSNANLRGLVWKTETAKDSSVFSFFNEPIYEEEEFQDYPYAGCIHPANMGYKIANRSVFIHESKEEKWVDGVHSFTDYLFDFHNLLVNNIFEWTPLGSRNTIVEYAHDNYSAMNTAGMLSQQYADIIREERSGWHWVLDLNLNRYVWSNSDYSVFQRHRTTWKQFGSLWLPEIESILSNAPFEMLDTTLLNKTDNYISTQTNLAYDSKGNLLKSKNANGQYTRYYYGSNEQPFNPNAAGLSNAYLTGISKVGLEDFFPDDSLSTGFNYDRFGNITKITDYGNNKTFCFTYDFLGRLSASYQPDGSKVSSFSYAYAGPSPSLSSPNQIQSTLFRSPTDFMVSTNYYDGIGYELQKQVRLGSDDIVQHTTYDPMRRVQRTYKPYLANVSHSYDQNYHIKDSTYYKNLGIDQYGYPYTKMEYNIDNGMLEHLHPPGKVFQETNYQSFQYASNGTLEVPGFNAQTLHKTTQKDENRNTTTMLFKDSFGNLVYQVVDSANLKLATKFTYDASGKVRTSTSPQGYTTYYYYDTRGLLRQKTSPDAGTVQYLYDKNGNLRFIKDANHTATSLNPGTIVSTNSSSSSSGSFTMNMPGKVTVSICLVGGSSGTISITKSGVTLCSATATSSSGIVTNSIYLPKGTYTWSFAPNGFCTYGVTCGTANEFVYNKYDGLNRLIETGEYLNNSTADFTQANADNTSFPASSTLVTKKYVYDITSTNSLASGQRNVKGRVSETDAYRLGSLCLQTFYSYDQNGRVEWTVQSGLGYYAKKMYYWYDLQGNIIKKEYCDLQTSRNMYTFYTYDQAGRLSTVVDSIAGVKIQDASYTYFASGKSKQLTFGGRAGNVKYYYNERDWMTVDTSSKFWEHLGYNLSQEIGGTPQYNGNISWSTYYMNASGINYPTAGWRYSYDNANRLNTASFGYKSGSTWTTTSNYSMPTISYDGNGNITTLQRAGSSGVLVDYLFYTYKSGTNMLTLVNNIAGNNTVYTYDANGNVLSDSYRGIAFIIYDINNLPVAVYPTSGYSQLYSYDVNGNRVRKYASNGTDTYYLNGPSGQTELVQKGVNNNTYTYNITGNDNIGQITVTSSTANRFYYLKDHLGNVKVTVNTNGGVDSYNDYYPFGMLMDGRNQTASADPRYKFTGKERDAETGLDYFGARYYDSRIGRWLSVDPLAEKYPSLSPYNYVANNPLKYFDPDGKKLKSVQLIGLNKADPVLKERTYYVDEKIADKLVNFVTKAREKFSDLSVNNIFRVESSSDIDTKNTKATGLSNHQAGFAVDLNGVPTLTDKQLSELNELAKENGLAPLAKQKDDLPHFEAKPADHGYKDLKSAVDENKKSYDELTAPPPKKEDEEKKTESK